MAPLFDPRLYRLAFVPLLLAVLVVAFSLEDRPRPATTTLAPDAFDGARARALVDDLAGRYPDRRPGSAGDDALAADVARRLRTSILPGAGARTSAELVRTLRTDEPTVDGTRSVETVLATRTGQPGPALVVVSERDALRGPDRGALSGTAAMLELARVVGDGRLERTITFVSTSGGTGGSAGVARAIRELDGPVDAVLVLGDLGSVALRKPWLVPWSSSASGQAPLRLRRTLESALRIETGQDPGAARMGVQFLRQALPVTTGAQGPLLAAGLPAVALSASGERGAPADGAVAEQRLEVFGRATLRALYALDGTQAAQGGPAGLLVTQRKVLPGWAVRLLVLALLAPVWVAAADVVVRARRRGVPIARGLRWVLGTTLPLLAWAAFVVALGLTGLVGPAPPGLAAPGAIPVRWPVVAAVVIVLVALWALLRPVLLRALGAEEGPGEEPGAVGALVVLALATAATWLVDPFCAALLVPAAHLWLLCGLPDVRIPRVGRVLLALLGLTPLLGAIAAYAALLGYGPGQAAWSALLLLAGGEAPPVTWVGWSVLLGCGAATLLLALRPRHDEEAPGAVASRGPVGYAGPGSLGGTASALRR